MKILTDIRFVEESASPSRSAYNQATLAPTPGTRLSAYEVAAQMLAQTLADRIAA